MPVHAGTLYCDSDERTTACAWSIAWAAIVASALPAAGERSSTRAADEGEVANGLAGVAEPEAVAFAGGTVVAAAPPRAAGLLEWVLLRCGCGGSNAAAVAVPGGAETARTALCTCTGTAADAAPAAGATDAAGGGWAVTCAAPASAGMQEDALIACGGGEGEEVGCAEDEGARCAGAPCGAGAAGWSIAGGDVMDAGDGGAASAGGGAGAAAAVCAGAAVTVDPGCGWRPDCTCREALVSARLCEAGRETCCGECCRAC